MQANFAGDMSQHATATRNVDPEHGVRQQLDDSAPYLNCVFARHVRISGSLFVIRTVCSKCADGRLSAVHTVQPSSSNRTSDVPMLIIGSIASVIPAFHFAPNAMPNKFAHHRKTVSACFILNFGANVPNASAFMGNSDSARECVFGRAQ